LCYILGANDNTSQVKNVNFDVHINPRKVASISTNTNDHRTVRACHIFHSNIKRTITRQMRETPV